MIDLNLPWQVLHADCFDTLKELPDNSVDAIVTDPPAGIAFMGKEWDDPRAWEQPISKHGFTDGGKRLPAPAISTSSRNPMCRLCHRHKRGWKDQPGCECLVPNFDDIDHRFDVRDYFITWLTQIMQECLRVLKPGGHALVWAIPRTSHWTATAVENAGFEIRDRVSHFFGTGFPKSADVSKMLDKAAGAEREIVGVKMPPPDWTGYAKGFNDEDVMRHKDCEITRDTYQKGGRQSYGQAITAPVTDAARQWDGWGTALKPAVEDWWLCRKPFVGTVAANVLKYSTGGLNIDACRVPSKENLTGGGGKLWSHYRDGTEDKAHPAVNEGKGRWPAHLVLSHTPECKRVGVHTVKTSDPRRADGTVNGCFGTHGIYSSGSQSRMSKPYYCDSEGKETVEDWDCASECPIRLLNEQSGDSGMASRFFPTFLYASKASRKERNLGGCDNRHPTVKNLQLMRWLCRLITPPNGIVLDPFCGSGSTGCAAMIEGFRFLGIEKDKEYVEIARTRIAYCAQSLSRSHDDVSDILELLENLVGAD